MSPLIHLLALQISTKEFVFRFDGKEAGSSIWRDLGEGRMESSAELDLQGFHISSKLNFTAPKGKIGKFDFDEKLVQGTKTVRGATMKFADGKVSIVRAAGEKPIEVPISPSLPLFANFHPGYLQGVDVAAAFDKAGKGAVSAKVNLFMNEGLAAVDLDFQRPIERTVQAHRLSVYPFKLATISGQMAFDETKNIIGWTIPSQKLAFELKGYSGVFEDSMAKYPELSQATLDTKTIEADIPMRDGVITKATVYLPKKDGRYPIILSRTPYGRMTSSSNANFFASRGYAFVVQDVRGTGDSKGQFLPMESERADGYDTLEWLDNQPWGNGNVGMIGASYGGYVQWAAAVERHPALKCIVPQVSPPMSAMWNLPYENGTLLFMSSLWWMRVVDNPEGNGALDAMAEMKNMKSLNILPLSKVDDKMFGFSSKIYDRWLTMEGAKKWPTFDFEALGKAVEIPVLHISGWFDGDEIGTQRNWMLGRSAGKQNQWLIYGPWTHFFNTTSSLQDVNFGASAILDLDPLYLRWFDTWLKEKQVGIEKQPKAKFFVTGSNKWVDASDWPMTGSHQEALQFDLAGKKLVSKVTATTAKTFVFDPATVKIGIDKLDLQSQGGTMFAKKSDLADDPVVLESAPVTADTTITGPMSIEFDFKSQAKDTDFYGEVWDLGANGKAYPAFRGGKLRAAFVNGLDQPRALVAGKTYRAKLTLWDAAHTVKKGHRLLLRIKSHNFPQSARNLGGMEPIATATKIYKQKNTIMSSPASPAVFKFQVLPAGAVK